MMSMHKSIGLIALTTLFAVGCADLAVSNPNDADRERALRTAGDLEALIGGGFGTWYEVTSSNSSSGPLLMTLAYQHSATAANFAMVEFSGWPKVPAHASPSDNFVDQNVGNNWVRLWRAASTSVEGVAELESGEFDLDAEDLARAKAFSYFVLGLVHGSVAVMYDQGYIFDPTVPVEEVALHPREEVLEASFGYFDQAIQEASAEDFTIPDTWMSREISSDELIRIAHSYRARLRAAMARTPEERQAVDWNAVISDIDAGITEPFEIDMRPGTGFESNTLENIFRFGPWGQLSYQVLGMADQSGQYQRWFARAPADRHPQFSETDVFLIITPDLRFAQGATLDEQRLEENKGTKFEISRGSGGFSAQWVRPDRGSFRWAYYRYHELDAWANNYDPAEPTDMPEITVEEMRLLRAEALYRMGDLAGAAEVVNETRVPAGLNVTDASSTNTSCVPKLPNGECGDLFEMLKWEVRLETIYRGLFMAPWYFHGRGWGDLTEGSFLELPVPSRELELLFLEPYTFGPGFESVAPVGTYGN